MMAIYGPLQMILSVVYFMMIIHIIMSWLINFQVLNLHQPFVAQIWIGLNKLLEPIYQPIRRICQIHVPWIWRLWWRLSLSFRFKITFFQKFFARFFN